MNSSNPLTGKKCAPCEGGVKPLERPQAEELLKNTPGWQINGADKKIVRKFVTKNFIAAVAFIGKIADIAEADNHHPDLHLTGYRNLTVELSTHAIGGLSENDFILAAKINELPVNEFAT